MIRECTYIICLQIWMILLESVIQNRYHDSLSGVAHFPSGLDVQIEGALSAAVLFGWFGFVRENVFV